MARDFALRRKAFLREHSADQEQGSHSRNRKDKARGKRPTLVDEDLDNLICEPEEAANPQGQHEPRKEDFYEALSNMEFSETRYPHPETMVALGINRDVSRLFEECHLGTFMETPFAGYKEETCQFLATLNVHFYENEQEAVEDGHSADEVGFATFEVNEMGHILLISQINSLFDFPPGRSTQQHFDKDELSALWKIIAGEHTYSSARSKSSNIRNPAIRYFHKALASTFFARKVTGGVNKNDLQMLDLALLRFLNIGRGDRIFRGDRADAGLTMVLLDQLMSYRDWATKLYRKRRMGELTVGGIITPILIAAGVELVTRPYEPSWLDLGNLAKHRILDYKRVNNSYIYRFNHPVVGEANLLLPNLPLTKITSAQNIDFCPPVESLYHAEPEQVQEDPAGDEFEEKGEPECYEFDDEPPAKTLKEANRRISLLQKWNKWQDKTIKALVSTVKHLSISKKEKKGKGKKTSSNPSLRRSGSFSFMRRSAPVDPPRRSAVEPRQKKRRAVPLDRGESSAAAPDYTEESMGDYTAQFFTQH